MKNRVLGVISLLTNIAIVGFVVFGIVSLFVPIFPTKVEYPFYQFQVLASCFVGLFSFIAIFIYINVIRKNKPVVPNAFQVFKLMANVCLGIVLIASFVYVLPTIGNLEKVFGGANFIFRIVVPILSIASYGLFEIHNKMKWRYTFLGIVPALLYIGFYFAWFFIMKKDSSAIVDWYDFGLKEGNYTKVVISTLIVVGVSYGLSFVIWLLNKFVHFIVYGYEYHDEDIPETPMYSAELIEKQEAEMEKESVEQPYVAPIIESEQPKVETTESEPSTVEETPSEEEKQPTKKSGKYISATYGKYDGRARVYHISRSKLIGGQWQVKLATGEKAIKLFETQKEAIEYAKKLVRTQGGSIRIHSMKGQMRK